MLLKAGDWQVDGFWSKPVRNRPGVFDDDPNPDVSLWGVYAVRPLAVLPDGHTDLYYLGYENGLAAYDQGTGRELRHSLGTRIWGRPMPWEYNGEYVWQFGRFGHGDIDAWTAANAVRYNFQGLPLKPRFGVRFDVASGDLNPPRRTSRRSTRSSRPALLQPREPPRPPEHHPPPPVLDLNFGERRDGDRRLELLLAREPGGRDLHPLRGPPPAGDPEPGRYIGSSPSLTTVWRATRHLTVLASYVHFFPGPYVKDNPPAKADRLRHRLDRLHVLASRDESPRWTDHRRHPP